MQSQAALRFLLIAAAICAPLGGAGWAAESPKLRDFDAYAAEGYREVALFAETKADDPALAAHFKKRAGLAAAGRRVQPERLGAWKLDSWTTREARIARSQLLAKLDGGARLRQPLLAAVAQVNFDCWLAPFPVRAGLRDSSECRRRFYIAFAQLQPVILPAVRPAPTTRLASTAKPTTPQVASRAKLKPTGPVLATAFGSISCDVSTAGDRCSQQFNPRQISALTDDPGRAGTGGADGHSSVARKPGQAVPSTSVLGSSGDPRSSDVATGGVSLQGSGLAASALGGIGGIVGGAVSGAIGGALGGAPVGNGNGNANGHGHGHGHGNGGGGGDD